MDQAKALLRAAWFYHSPCAAYFVLKLWAGLRECEVQQLNASDLESSTVRVGERTIKLAQNVITMLALLRQEGKLNREALTPSPRVIAAVIQQAGFQKAAQSDIPDANKPIWTRHIMRHTAISYHLAQQKIWPLRPFGPAPSPLAR